MKGSTPYAGSYRSCYIESKCVDGKPVVTWYTPSFIVHQAKTVEGAKRAITAWWKGQIDSHYSTKEFSVALYKPPNQYGLFDNRTGNWMWFGKKSNLVRMAAQLNIGEKMT